MKNTILTKKLGVFSIAMMSVAGIFSIRSLPTMANYGLTSISYYLLGALLFFIPSALICAELATGWPKTGGLYVWVREAHGRRLGFSTIWLQWTKTVVSFPTMLSFGAATLFYLFMPSLAQNKQAIFIMMLIFFWSSTALNLLGVRLSMRLSSISTLLGLVLPTILIIVLGFSWWFMGQPIHLTFSAQQLVPNLHWHNAAFLSGMILGYAGMQVAGFHGQDVDNPQRNYPRAMFIAAIMILIFSILGALSVAMVIPREQISLIAGLMQLITVFLQTFHLGFLIPAIAFLILIGFVATLNIWVIGPSRGLFACAEYGDLPKILCYRNKHGAPVTILLAQAIVGSLLSLLFLYLPTVSSSYWLLIVLEAQLTFMMDVLLFSAVLRLRYTQPLIPRAYRIPGGKAGVWLVAGVAILVCIFGFFIGFFPPSDLIDVGSQHFYTGFLIAGILIISLPAWFIHRHAMRGRRSSL